METLTSGLVLTIQEGKSCYIVNSNNDEVSRISVLKVRGRNTGRAARLQLKLPKHLKILQEKPDAKDE